MEYLRSVPGDDSGADAVNLVLAAMNGHDLIAETIVRRQPDGCLIPLLGTVTAMLVTMTRGMDPRAVEHYLKHLAEASGKPPAARRRRERPGNRFRRDQADDGHCPRRPGDHRQRGQRRR